MLYLLCQSQPTATPPVISRHPEVPVPDLRVPPPKTLAAPHMFREKCRLKRHTKYVSSVAFSPNGEQIVSGSKDQSNLIWDWRTGKVTLGPLFRQTSYVMSVAFSPDGQQIVSGGGNGAVVVWDAKSGKTLHRLLRHGKIVRSVAFSPDSRMIASGSYDLTVQIWDAKTGEIVHSMTFGAYVCSVMFSPNGEYLAIGTVYGVEVWDVRSWQRVCGRQAWCCAIAISPDGKHVAYSDGKTLCIMDLKTGEPIMGPTQEHAATVHCLAFSPDGTWIASGSWEMTTGDSDKRGAPTLIHIWDAATGNQISNLDMGSSVFSIAISPSGMQIAVGCSDSTVYLYSCDSVL